jgi:D-alanyl-D-alanine carboxypeptidase (penicillin-binding protein 5/6)
LAIYPGQNRYQLLETHPTGNQIKGMSIDLGATEIPYWNGIEAPALTATAAVIFEPVSGTILFQRNLDQPLPPASTTKIMTALVSLDSYALDAILPIKDAPAAVGSSMKLKSGEKMTVRNLMTGLLVASANDAALTLAENYPTGYNDFVAAMNQKAAALHLTDTHFSNVSGIEADDHNSSVRDLVILSKEAFKNDFFRSLVSTTEATISDVSGNHRYQLSTTNLLLGKVEGVAGVKTGWTEAAGECLVTFVERDGHKLFIAVLGSGDRFGETKQLIDWSYRAHVWKSL